MTKRIVKIWEIKIPVLRKEENLDQGNGFSYRWLCVKIEINASNEVEAIKEAYKTYNGKCVVFDEESKANKRFKYWVCFIKGEYIMSRCSQSAFIGLVKKKVDFDISGGKRKIHLITIKCIGEKEVEVIEEDDIDSEEFIPNPSLPKSSDIKNNDFFSCSFCGKDKMRKEDLLYIDGYAHCPQCGTLMENILPALLI